MKIWKQIVCNFLNIFKSPSLKAGPYPLNLFSKELARDVYIELYLPPFQKEPWSLLIINDGQDAPALSLLSHFDNFRKKQSLMIVAIHAGNRLDEYGTARISDYQGRGKKSEAYQLFIIKELLPYLHKKYPISAAPSQVGIAGFSLGGLSAIDMAWHHPKIFGICGIFSGALWWRSKDFLPQDPDANRVIHEQVKMGSFRAQRFWFQAGTADELEDRNNNGIIDAIDDTLQLIDLLKEKIPNTADHLKYVEVPQGEHHPTTWGEVFPNFLEWAFLKK